MATEKINIWMRLKGAKQAQSGMKSLGTTIKNNIAKFAAMGIGITVVTKYLKSMLDAYGAQELAEKKLSAALGKHSDLLLKQASALQKVTTYGDEETIAAQARLAAYTKNENQLMELTRATQDFAAGLGMDLNSAADLIGKTIGSTTNALTRYGVEVKGAVGSSERLEQITAGVAKLWGGQAKAAAETYTGAIKQMSNALGDSAEEMGSVLAPMVIYLANLLKNTAIMFQGGFGVDNKTAELSVTYKTTRALLAQLAAAKKGTEEYNNLKEALGDFNQVQEVQKEQGLAIVDNLKEMNKIAIEYGENLKEIPEINEDIQSTSDKAFSEIETKYQIMNDLTSQFSAQWSQALLNQWNEGQNFFDNMVRGFRQMIASMLAELAGKAALFAIFNALGVPGLGSFGSSVLGGGSMFSPGGGGGSILGGGVSSGLGLKAGGDSIVINNPIMSQRYTEQHLIRQIERAKRKDLM